MPWYDEIFERLSDYAKSKVRQLESLFSKGLAPQQANHIVKETSAILPENRRGLQPHEAYQLWNRFNQAREETIASLPSRRSDWLRAGAATPSHFNSPMGNRYLIDFSYDVEDISTGEITTVYYTYGLRRLGRWGSILNRLESRMLDLLDVAKEGDNYILLNSKKAVEGSLQVRGFYRTTNL